MTDNRQRAAEVSRSYFGRLVDGRGVEDTLLTTRLAVALDEAEARGRAERGEQVGEVVAALVARAEVAEAALRAVLELADVRKANAQRPPLTLVTTSRRCLVHDQSFTNVCSGCRADEIAAEETA